MKIRFLRGKASNGCTALCNGLKDDGHDVKKLLISNSRYRGNPNHLIINWGSASRRSIRGVHNILNDPAAVEVCSNKLKTFMTLSEEMAENLPKFCTSKDTAHSFIEDEHEVVYCRTLARASEGRGIVIASQVDQLVSAPLYTCKVDVDREVRIHVFRGEVIDYAQKKRMGSERRETEGIESVDEDIRSHSRGWIFAREGVHIPEDAKDVAPKAVDTLGLDFGAVDMAITPQGAVKIYEVNSAPGLEGTTLTSYLEGIRKWIDEQ